MKFQRVISSSQATLPVVCAIAAALWFVLPLHHGSEDFLGADYGVWQYLPDLFHDYQYALPLGIICAAIGVYMMVELKNRNLLLRVNSYMLSSTLALLLALCAPLHPLQPSSLITIFVLYAYFPLFASYQIPHPYITFPIYLPLSIASLLLPQLLLLAPVYWCLQIYLRSFTFRNFIASLIAILLPYWFYGAIAVVTDSTPQFIAHLQAVVSTPDLFAVPSLSDELHRLSTSDILTSSLPALILTIIMLIIGIVDFQQNSLLDKTRTRSLYKVVIWHAVSIIIAMALFYRHANTFLPILMLDTSILYGHFFTLTHTRASHIINIIVALLMTAVLAVQCL